MDISNSCHAILKICFGKHIDDSLFFRQDNYKVRFIRQKFRKEVTISV